MDWRPVMNAVERRILQMPVEQVSGSTQMTPYGSFSLIACERGLMYAGWGGLEAFTEYVNQYPSGELSRSYLQQASSELDAYFRGTLSTFSVPLVYQGTPFQEAVWSGLMTIPFGETWSYRQLAVHIGNPLAVRAVGQANRANRIAVIIPCHRVIGADGGLVGYAGTATDLKASLIGHEHSVVAHR